MAEPLGTASLRRWRLRIFLLAWITYAVYYLGRVNLSVAVPAMSAEEGWNRAALGLVASTFYWCYAVGQLINGQIGERLSARRLVAVGLVASALLNWLFGGMGALGAMLVVWGLNGFAQATGWAPIMKTLAHWFEPRHRGRLTTFFAPCYVVGNSLSWALAGLMIAASGWRAAFRVPAGLLLAMAAIWYLLARDAPPAPAPTGEVPARPALLRGIASSLAAGWRTPRLRWGLVTCFLSGMVKDSLTLWGPTYLIETHGLAVSTGALAASLIPVAGALGVAAAGWVLGARPVRHEAKVVTLLAGLMALAAGGLLLGMGRALPATVALLGLLAAGSHGVNALLMTALPLSLGREGQVSAAAGALDFGSYVGGGLSVALIGGLQLAIGWAGVYLWWLALAALMGGLAWWAGRRQAPAGGP
ncbi:MAG: MFS transporter [Chloroflexota bacterium]